MNLWDLQTKQTAVIDSIECESPSDYSKITGMGFCKNSKVKCLHKTFFNGPRVFEIDGKVCSLCQLGASKIKLR